MGRPALFLDRDGTIIAHVAYPSDPAQVRLMDGAAPAIAAANAAQVPVVVITNQSGIGRGLITPAQYEAVRQRLDELLTAEGAHLDGTEHCPHWPDRDGPCACRKPGIGMHEAAAQRLRLALPASVYIGDRWLDVQPALTTGGLGILVPCEETPMEDLQRVRAQSRVREAGTIAEAVHMGLDWITRARGGASAGASWGHEA